MYPKTASFLEKEMGLYYDLTTWGSCFFSLPLFLSSFSDSSVLFPFLCPAYGALLEKPLKLTLCSLTQNLAGNCQVTLCKTQTSR